MERPIYITASGQRDNVGDTALRRALLARLAGLGPLHVGVTSMPDAYIAGLELPPDAHVHRDGWDGAVVRAARHRNVVHVGNPGEVQLHSRRGARTFAKTAVVGIGARARGGALVITGVGVQDPSPRSLRLLGASYRLADLVAWRDRESRDALGVGRVEPDWAFASGDVLGAPGPDDRDVMALSLRFDRPALSDHALACLAAAAAEMSLRIVTVAQVKRDVTRAEDVAAAVGGEVLTWNGDDLRSEEEHLRALYRRSLLVVGDRLHALVIGATEGALPVEVRTSDSRKPARAFAAAGVDLPVLGAPAWSPDGAVEALAGAQDRRASVVQQVAAAGVRLDALGDEVHALAAG